MATSPKTTPRLRASCDGCYTAKIKCTKEKPACPRCKSLGIVCHYSPSQRAGGRSREVRSRHSASLGSTASSRLPDTPSSNVSPMIQTDCQPQYIKGASFQSPDGSQPLWSDMTMSDCPSSLTDFDDDFLKPWRDYLPTPESEPQTFNMSEDLVAYSDPPTSFMLEQQLIPAARESNKDHGSNCECFQSILQALHAIETQARGSRTPSLELVLSASKDVIAKGETVLRCTCSDDSTLIMLLTGLIAKHLSSYGGVGNPLVSSPSSSLSASDNCASLPTSRVTIGRYTMDGDDEERLRIEIMMMELQKLSPLLMKFRSKFSSLPVGYEGHTNETVLNFLNMRLREATDGLQREKQRLSRET